MRPEQHSYYRALGAHVAQLRKARGMTQAELARGIGVSQQAVFAYEIADRRVSVFILIKLARIFSVTVEELMGLTRPVRVPKRRLSPRAMRHAERLQALSKTQQRFVVRILDILEAGTVRWSANQHSRRTA
jgi:transcriptional regulator with XRE-family HTH domain